MNNLTVETCYNYLTQKQKLQMFNKLKNGIKTAYIFTRSGKKYNKIKLEGKYYYTTEHELAQKIINDENLYYRYKLFSRCELLFEKLRDIVTKLKDTRLKELIERTMSINCRNSDESIFKPTDIHKIYQTIGYKKFIKHLKYIVSTADTLLYDNNEYVVYNIAFSEKDFLFEFGYY